MSFRAVPLLRQVVFMACLAFVSPATAQTLEERHQSSATDHTSRAALSAPALQRLVLPQGTSLQVETAAITR
jgi:hypothetical protein